MDVDYSTKTYDFAVDGVPMNTEPIPFYHAASDNFVQVRIFRGAGQAGMIVDDLRVEPVPEPGSALLLLAGAMALCSGRKGRLLRV
jgi:hypothetical protein